MADSQASPGENKTTTVPTPNDTNSASTTPGNFAAVPSVGPQAATSPLGVSSPLQGEELKATLISRLDTIFTRDNLATDLSTVSKMGSDLSMPLASVLEIPFIKTITQDEAALTEAIRATTKVVFDEATKMVKPTFKLERNTIILRDCAAETTAEDIRNLLTESSEVTASIKEVKPDIQNSWFLSFTTEDLTHQAYNILRSKQLHGQQVWPRIKSETLLKGTNPYVPSSASMYSQYAIQQQMQMQQQFANGGGYPYPPRQPYRGGYRPPQFQQPFNPQQQGLPQDPQDPNAPRGQKNNRGAYSAAQKRPPRGAGGPRGPGRGAGNALPNASNGSSPSQKSTSTGNNPAPNGGDAKKAGNRGANGRRNQGSPNAGTAKRPVGGKASVQPPMLGSSHFPPLGTQTAAGGYQKPDVKHYSKEQIISIISSTKDLPKAEFQVNDLPVVSPLPISELETTKPVPPNTQIFEASKTTRRSSSSGAANKPNPTPKPAPANGAPTAAAIVAQNIPPQPAPAEKKPQGASPKAAAKKSAPAQPKKPAQPTVDTSSSEEKQTPSADKKPEDTPAADATSATPSYAAIAKAQAEANDKSKKASGAKKGSVANGTAPSPSSSGTSSPVQPKEAGTPPPAADN